MVFWGLLWFWVLSLVFGVSMRQGFGDFAILGFSLFRVYFRAFAVLVIWFSFLRSGGVVVWVFPGFGMLCVLVLGVLLVVIRQDSGILLLFGIFLVWVYFVVWMVWWFGLVSCFARCEIC